MPFSLNLPYPVCYAAVRLARSMRPPRSEGAAWRDQGAYYDMQYRTSGDYAARFLGSFPFRGVVLDVGAGLGGRAPHWLERGADRVINVDINRQELEAGRQFTDERFPDHAHRIDFRSPEEVDELADGALLVDSFEHLTAPGAVLDQIGSWLRPGGVVWAGSMGWYHHQASHVLNYIPLPWCQLLFSDKAIVRTIRSVIREPGYRRNVWEEAEGIERWDAVTTLRDRPGEPLNMLSLAGCKRAMRSSPFDLVEFRVHGFSGRSNRLAALASSQARIPLLQEVFHSYYTALLRKPADCRPQQTIQVRTPAALAVDNAVEASAAVN